MLIVGAGLMIAAIAAFLAWNGIRKCQERWRERNANRLLAEKNRGSFEPRGDALPR